MKTKGIIIFILMMFAMSSALFAGGFALSGIGSKAIGMGGAFRGLADDPTAMYWNPAGLSFMNQSCVTLAGAAIMPSSEFTGLSKSVIYSGTMVPFDTLSSPGFAYNQKMKAEKKTWMFPNAFGVYSSESPLKFGLGAYVPYGLGATWDLYQTPDSMEVARHYYMHVVYPATMDKNEMMSSIGIVDIHPTLSYKLSDNLAIGAGISVQYGMIEIQKLKMVNAYIPMLLHLKGTGLGFGANMGVLWKATSKLQVGVSGKLPSIIKLEGDGDASVYLNNVIIGVPASSGMVKTDKSSATADVKLPADVGIGFAFYPVENWVVTMDLTNTYWSCFDKVEIEFDDTLNVTFKPEIPIKLKKVDLLTDWNDTFRFSMGTEYKMSMMAIRLGFYYDESPIADKSLSPTWPDTNDKMSGNIGVGLKFGQMDLDVNFEHIVFTDREIKTQTADNMIGTYTTSINAANAALTLHF